MTWHYSDDRKRIILDERPSRFKYITGTRLASILGLNEYSSPFQSWCECTKILTPPYEDTIYTMFGKINEPKQRAYVAQKFPNIVGPEEYFGGLYETVKWNFFDEKFKPFAGLWDAVSTKNDGKTIAAVIEFKTASSPVKWCNNEVPISYGLQGALYAKLLGLDKVIFVVSFPERLDYAHPEKFKVTPENTKIIVKKLSEMYFNVNGEYLDIEGCMEKAEQIWNEYVITGISPEFDEELDKEYLSILRKNQPVYDTELSDLCNQAIEIAKSIDTLSTQSGIKELEKELKILEKAIKEGMLSENLDVVGKYKLKRATKQKFNEKLFAQENEKLYNRYIEETISYTLSKDMKEGED